MIRLLVRDTIEASILEEQKRKMNARSTATDATMTDVDPGTILALLENHP